MSIERLPQFLQATQSTNRRTQGYNQQGYHQAYQEGAPTTTPRVVARPTSDDMEKALAYLETGRVSGLSSNQSIKTAQINPKGKAWEGFSVPENNGRGEVIPQYAKGERLLDINA